MEQLIEIFTDPGVALLAEGVDRNTNAFGAAHILTHVALLAEGVDRNFVPNRCMA